MNITLVSAEEVFAAQQKTNVKEFKSLSTFDLECIKKHFSLDLECGGKLLNCYRFQAAGIPDLTAFLKLLTKKGIASYCKDLGWTIYNPLIIEAVK